MYSFTLSTVYIYIYIYICIHTTRGDAIISKVCECVCVCVGGGGGGSSSVIPVFFFQLTLV